MEKKHKEILISQRANLVENLNVRDGLFTQLIAKKILKQRTVRSIQTGRTLDEQAEVLLDEIPKLSCGPNAFNLFCEALIDDGQEAIVDLFLRPENKSDGDSSKSDVDKDVCVQESSRASSGSDTPETTQGDVAVLQSINTPGSVEGEHIATSSGPSGCLPPSIAIREEFEHQMYRRSIEPGGHNPQLFMNTKAPSGGDLEHEARFFYQNSILDPRSISVSNSVYSVLKDPRLSQIEKQKILSSFSPSGSPMKTFPPFGDSPSLYGKDDPLLVRDSMCEAEHSQMASFLSEKKSQNNMFAHPPQSQNKGSNPFSFQTTDRFANPLSTISKSDTSNLQSVPIGQGQGTIDMSHDPVVDVRLQNRGVDSIGVRSIGADREHLLSQWNNPSSIHEIQYSPSKHSSVDNSPHDRMLVRPVPTSSVPSYHPKERESINMPPRYIEVSRPGENGSQRDMVSLPRHIERAPPASVHYYSRLQNEELISRGENIDVGRLRRNDSVDTMNKRPFAENQDTNAKRFREDVDTIQELQKSEKLTTLKVYDGIDNKVITIPVIDEPRKQPSLPAVVIETDTHQDKSMQGSFLGMDDDEIDLTDGPINVKVELSNKQFYLGHYKQAYAMRSIPRGKALILNVNEVVGKSARRGTDIDRDNLHNLLCQLHYDVTVYNDIDGLTAKEMVLKLQDFSQDAGHKNADCAFICILSHGEEGYIFGSDGKKFELDAVFSLFDNTCCSHLRGKPKIFIIQACRGGVLDRGVQYYPDEHDGSDARVRQVPSMSDMIICYPTQHGYYAWRNRDRGSWYVEALVQVFMKYARCEDLCTMLNRVNLLVSKKVSHCPTAEMDQMSQMSEYKSTLRMPHLFLFPGIGGYG